jgi:hypothetical protein
MKQSEVDKAKEVLRIKPRPKDVIVRIQLLSAKASMKDDRTGSLIISLMLTEIERDPDSFKDAWGAELFKPSSILTLSG